MYKLINDCNFFIMYPNPSEHILAGSNQIEYYQESVLKLRAWIILWRIKTNFAVS